MVTLIGYRRRIRVEALVDRGARISQITRPLARRLGVRRLGVQELDVAGGKT